MIRRLPVLLGGGVLALLLVALVLPAPAAPGEESRSASVMEPGDDGVWPLPGAGTVAAVRRSTLPPTPAELDALEGLAGTVPLLVAHPDGGMLLARPPRAPRTERVSAVTFTLRGGGAGEVQVRLTDGAGVLDSTVVALDSAGRGEGAFRVRPSRPGWHEWRVEAEGVGSRTVGAWVRDPVPLRVVVAAGPPTWESRFLMRALDESGVESDAVLPLGEEFHAGGVRSLPVDPAGLGEVDVVVVLPGATLDAASLDALRRFVVAGGGVAAVGRPDLWEELGLTSRGGVRREPTMIPVSEIRWWLPPELIPLPGADLRVAALPLEVPVPVVTVAAPWPLAEAPGADAAAPAPPAAGPGFTSPPALLALRPLGAGRVAGLGVLESWRWRMEVGQMEAHRDFWRGLVEWLAGDGRDAPAVRLTEGIGAAGVPVRVEGWGTATERGRLPFHLVRPDGTPEELAVSPGSGGGVAAAFLPDTPGIYLVEGPGGRAPVGFRGGGPEGPQGEMVARLAFVAHRSGGVMVPPSHLEREVEARLAAVGSAGRWSRWVLLVGILGLAVMEWTVRRLSGRP